MEKTFKKSGVFVIGDLFSTDETIPKAVISYNIQLTVPSDVFIRRSVYDSI